MVRGGELIDESGRRRADLRITHGTIIEVADAIKAGASDRLVDASGCVITPGLIDLQAHLRDPGPDHVDSIETGTAAAAQGGITALVSMPNTAPCIDTPELVRYVNDRARALGCLLYTSPSPRDMRRARMPSSA